MRKILIDAQTSYLVGGINKHKANIEVYMGEKKILSLILD